MKLLAQGLNLPGGTAISGPEGFRFTRLGEVVESAIKFVFAFAGIALLLMIIAAGLTLMTSAGDAKKIEQGKQRLTYSLVGFLIIFTAYWLVQILGRIFGFEEITKIFG